MAISPTNTCRETSIQFAVYKEREDLRSFIFSLQTESNFRYKPSTPGIFNTRIHFRHKSPPISGDFDTIIYLEVDLPPLQPATQGRMRDPHEYREFLYDRSPPIQRTGVIRHTYHRQRSHYRHQSSRPHNIPSRYTANQHPRKHTQKMR